MAEASSMLHSSQLMLVDFWCECAFELEGVVALRAWTLLQIVGAEIRLFFIAETPPGERMASEASGSES